MSKLPPPLYDPERPGLPHRSVARDRLPARESSRAWMSDRWGSWPELSSDALRIVGDYRPQYLGQEAPSVVLAERVRREPSPPPYGSYQHTVLAWIRTQLSPVDLRDAPSNLTSVGHFQGACKHLVGRGVLKARVLWVRGVRGRASEYWPTERPWPPLPDGTVTVKYNPPECAP